MAANHSSRLERESASGVMLLKQTVLGKAWRLLFYAGARLPMANLQQFVTLEQHVFKHFPALKR
jgi:hypothetical protein